MSDMGRYCKAYLAKKFREFPGWQENIQNLRKKTETGEEIESRELSDDDILYLQENYVITDGIYKNENIIFDRVDEEWKMFCEQVLEFKIPVFEPIETKTSETAK